MWKKIFFSFSILVCSFDSYCQMRCGQVNFSGGNNHLLQSSWNPYENQPWLGLSYFRKLKDRELIMDAGLNLSFDFNDCDNCRAASSGELTYDADVIAVHFGIGKWWIKDKSSIFLTVGGLAAYSEYTAYNLNQTMSYSSESSNRGHAGIYFRSGMDFKISKKGLRFGPILETRISTGKSERNLYLNINSIILGINLGIRTGDQTKI